jgi:hypothetical protein
VNYRFPNAYQVVQQIPQWRPVLNRYFWIDPKPATIYQPPTLPGAAGFDWDQPPDLTGGAVLLAERVQRAFGSKACALLLRGPTMNYVLNDFSEMKFWRAGTQRTARPYVTDYYPTLDTIRELCQRTPDQLFAYVSTLSPNGGPELDDLAIADATNPNQSVLVIAVETESTLHLYRRLYSGSK